jgi:type VI secretion system protein ImpG
MATVAPTVSADEQSTFDEEMSFLANIQSSFLNLHGQAPVEYDDPDVKHLTEAMAAFMAKGRMAGKQQIDQLHKRVFQQLLPYIASPVASMGLVQANTRYLTEATEIKAGTAFSVISDDDERAQYRSLSTMPLRPISIERAGYQPNSSSSDDSVSQLLLTIKAHTRVPGQLEHLPLYLTVNNNFSLSLQLKHMLKERLIGVSATFDEGQKISGRFVFGQCEPQSNPNNVKTATGEIQTSDLHPIEGIRRFFQLPHQENYLNLYFDDPPQQWSRCELVLSLNKTWPKQPKFSAELFQLGVISIENIIQEQAAAFNYDATQSAHPVRPPATAADLGMLKCLGVYQGAIKNRDLLRPGILKGGNGAYELHYQRNAHPLIDIQLAEAFTKPVKISLDALWHQPGFSQHLWKKLSVRTLHLDIPGLHCKVFTPPVPYVPFSDNSPHSLMELSLLKNKDVLSLEDVLFILETFGSVFRREFRLVKPLLKSLNIHHQVNYCFELHDYSAQLLPLLNTFLAKLEALLNLWSPEAGINVSLRNAIGVESEPISEIFEENDFIPEIASSMYKPDQESTKELDDNEYSLLPASPESLFLFEDVELSSSSTTQSDSNHE